MKTYIITYKGTIITVVAKSKVEATLQAHSQLGIA